MAANLSREARLERMRRAWQLAVDGSSQQTIARELGISQPQVSRYLHAMRKRMDGGMAEEAITYAILSLRQNDRVIEEAFKAFERSTRPKKTAKKTTSPDGNTKAGTPADGVTTTQVTEREGEPTWLSQIRDTIRLRHEILDRIAPPKPPVDQDKTSGAATVADALLEAERRDAEYQRAKEIEDAGRHADQDPQQATS